MQPPPLFRFHQRAARVIALAAFCLVASLSLIHSQESEPVIKEQGIRLNAEAWDKIRVQDSEGNRLLTFTGFELKGTSGAKICNGTVRQITATDGNRGVEVHYETLSTAPDSIKITGQFVVRPKCVDVQFDVCGVPENAKIDGSMFGRTLPQDASEPEVKKMGLWQRHAYGGIPYEVPDGKLIRYNIGKQELFFAYDAKSKVNPEWKDGHSQHAGLVKTGQGTYRATFSVLISPGDWPAEAITAQWHKRLLALKIGTPEVYNWWTDNRTPLTLNTQVINTSNEPRTIVFKHWVRNFSGTVVSQNTCEVSLQPAENHRQDVLIKAPSSREILFAEVSATDQKTGQEVFARTNLTVLPPHAYTSTSADSLFGMAAYWPLPNEASVQRLMDRMGVRWLREGDTRAYQNITAIHHSNIKWKGPDMPAAEREAWIKGELQKCVERKNPWWEFGNELNMSTAGIGMEGTGIGHALLAEKYVEWLKEIRRVQNETGMTHIKILSFGMAGMDVKFVEKFVALGGWDLIDGLALHPGRGNFTPDYPVSLPTEEWHVGKEGNYWNYYGSICAARSLLDKYGGNKPLWLTEVYSPTFPNSFWEDSLHHATENVVLSFALAKAEGVQAVMWYQLFDSIWSDRLGVSEKNREYHFGLVNRDLSLKPMVLAYCTIAEALDGATFKGWLNFANKDLRGLLFDTPSGPMAVLWSRADGYILSQKAEHFASPEPWVDEWKTQTSVSLPAAGSQVIKMNPIGQTETLPSQDGSVKLTLTGAPAIVYGLNAAMLKMAK